MRSTDCIAIAPPYLAILFKKVVFEKEIPWAMCGNM